MPKVEPIRFQTLSPAEAVLRYAGDFIPSWAGAISIDLMPAVLVLILCVVHASIRREGLPAFNASDMTAGELVAALHMVREVGEAQRRQCLAQQGRRAKALPSRRRQPTKTSPRCRRRGRPNSASPCRIFYHTATRPCLAVGTCRRNNLALDFPQRAPGHDRTCSRSTSPSMQGWIVYPDRAIAPTEIREDSPALNLPGMLPSILAPLLPHGDNRLMPLPQPDGAMAQPMTFELVGGGRLMANGTITPEISQSFAAEAERHGEYIKTVVLNSPGGSVTDALAMGRLDSRKEIRDRSRGGEILRVVVPAGVCRRRRATRRRQGHDRRAPGGGDALRPRTALPATR